MSKNNLLTIIMPVYNGWPYIKYAVESILKQTFTNYTLIIINDGSTDYTNEYLNRLNNSKIIIKQKNHTGIIDSFNEGLNFTSTRYTARIDADDFYYPDKFEKQIYFLEANKKVILLGSNAFYMNENNVVTNYRIIVPQTHENILKDLFEKKRGIIQSSIVMRTEVLKKLKGYRPNIYPEDYDLYFRFGQEGKLYNLKDSLVSVRIHKSYTYKNLKKLLDNCDNLRKTYLYKYDYKESEINSSKVRNNTIFYIQRGIYFYLNNQRLKGILHLSIGFILSPSRLFEYLLKLVKLKLSAQK